MGTTDVTEITSHFLRDNAGKQRRNVIPNFLNGFFLR